MLVRRTERRNAKLEAQRKTDESKQQKNPQIEKDTVLGDLQCKLQYMNGRGNLRGYALEAP
jgi:hypothetical protein